MCNSHPVTSSTNLNGTFKLAAYLFQFSANNEEKVICKVCRRLANEIKRLESLPYSELGKEKLKILTTYQTSVFEKFNLDYASSQKAVLLAESMESVWGSTKENMLKTLHQDRDSLAYLRALGAATAFLLPLLAMLVGLVGGTENARRYGAVFTPRGWFGSQTRSERTMTNAMDTIHEI